MSTTHANKIDIIKSSDFKINEVDFENLFRIGIHRSFTRECDFINGEWQNLLLSLTPLLDLLQEFSIMVKLLKE
jgi:hypothetical protein